MNINKDDVLVKIYELGYHLIPSLAEEEVPQYVNKIKDTLDSYGAIIISEEMPQRMDLAYTMYPSVNNKKQKYTQSYFGWIKFEVDTESAHEFKTKVEDMQEVFRSLLIITVRENTLAPKKIFNTFTKRKYTKNSPEAEKLDIAEVDKEIDALVEEEAVVPAETTTNE